MGLYNNRTNAQIVGHANNGDEAVTSTGNFSTSPGNGLGQGSMNHRLFWALCSFRPEIEQVIYSYWTPIAIKIRGIWVIPDISYSATTSGKHKSQLYQLRDNDVSVPWDATVEDIERILDGKMRYVKNWTGDKIGRYVAV